ncbi:hypothetical protein [Kitasatospora sp. NPDC001095]
MGDERVARAGRDQVEHEGIEGFGQLDGPLAEVEKDVLPVLADAVAGQLADAAGGLGVQEHEKARDAVGGGKVLVVQEPAGGGPAGVLVVRACRAWPPDRPGHEIPRGVAVAYCPADEGRALPQVRGLGRGVAVEVGLRARAEGLALLLQPVQERCGRARVGADVLELLVTGGRAVKADAEVPQQVPVEEAAQGSLVLAGLEGVDRGVDLAFQTGQSFVAELERADGHQHRAEVVDRLARCDGVERGVGDVRVLADEGGDGGADVLLAQPGDRVVGMVDPDEPLAQPVQLGCDGAVGGGEQLPQAGVEAASRAGGGGELPGGVAGAAPFPEGWVGVGAAGAQWLVECSGPYDAALAASAAHGPVAFAQVAQRLAGDAGDRAAAEPAADAAGAFGAGPALLAHGPGLGTAGDPAPYSAARADLRVAWVAGPA